jgi:uncharacterized protein (UPF0332 family)
MFKAKKSIDIAESKLAEARELLSAGFKNNAAVTAYSSMFHAGRALLYRDGIQEKSHFCLIVYLKEIYASSNKITPEIITLMDSFREQRHNIMYGFEIFEVSEEEVEEAIESASKLIGMAKSLIGK